MQQPYILYDDYFNMCDAVLEWKISKNNISIPKHIIERFINNDMIYSNLIFLTWIIENEIIDDKNLIKRINKKIVDSYHFSENKSILEQREKVKLTYEEYYMLEKLANEIKINGWNPELEDMKTYFEPYIKYGAGFFIMVLLKFQDQSKTKWYKSLKKKVADSYELIEDKSVIRISQEDFDRIRERADTVKLNEKNWWPEKEDIYKYMIPNIEKSIPFLIYLLKDGRETNSIRDIESKAILQDILDRKISIIQNGGIIWQ